MGKSNRCQGCGETRPADAPAGLCPNCLLKAGFLGEESHLPDLTITFGPASSSVLKSFGDAFGKIPPVLLRDADSVTDPAPVIRPLSEEIPDPADRSARLQIFGEIARGGMGAVLKGRDSDLGRDLAVKILLESHRDKPELIRRFIEEAQIAGQLQHPGVVPIYELGAFGDRRPYFAMKLVKGHTLAEILATRKSPAENLPRFLSIFESICQTMAYAHARGVIHRDLKPSNVMVGSFGEVQVMDWGLAKVLPRGGAVADASAGHTKDEATIIATARSEDNSDHSKAGSIMGTPSYMAPEQARGEIEQIDERADVFALGSIFCELLTGEPAFTGRSSSEIQRRSARGELTTSFARLDKNAFGSDPQLIKLAKSCLAPQPENRPRNAGEVSERVGLYHSRVQERLRQAEIERAEEKARAEEATKRAAVERDRRRLTLGLAGSIVGFTILGVGGWAYFARQNAARQAATERIVSEAIDKATLLRGQAKAAPVGDLSKWAEALAAANQASSSLKVGEKSEPLQERVDLLLTSLEQEQAEATRRATEQARDRAFFDRLEAIRFEFAQNNKARFSWKDPETAKKADAAYATAFREFGINPITLDPAESARRFRQRGRPVEFASRLDDWALIHKAATNSHDTKVDALCLRLIETAQATDDDAWRNSIRSLIARWDHPAARKLAADDEQLSRQSARSLYLLAEVVEDTRGFYPWTTTHLPETMAILKCAWMLNPNDYQICRKLHIDSPRAIDRRRFATAAVAAAPNSPHARMNLADELLPTLYEYTSIRERNRLKSGVPRDKSVSETMTACEFPLKNGEISIIGVKRFDRKSIPEEDLKEGILQLREGIRLDPNSVLLREKLAMALIWEGRYDDAMAEARTIAAIDPRFPQGGFLGCWLFNVGELDRALALVQQEIQRIPDASYDFDLMGLIYYQRGQKEQALAAFRESLFRAIESPEFNGNWSSVSRIGLESIGTSKDVIATYRQAIQAHPRDDLVLALAELLLKEGMVDEALALYREELAAHREHSELASRLAEHFSQAGHGDKALAVYREGIKALPESLDLHLLLAKHLKSQGTEAEWTQEIDKVILLYPAALQVKFNDWGQAELAALYLERGRRDEAREQFRVLIKKSTHHNCMNKYAMQLSTSHDEKARDGTIAVELATRVCELTGWGDSTYLDTLAAAYAEVGDFDAAVKWQSKAIELLKNPQEKSDFESRLKLYREKKAYRY